MSSDPTWRLISRTGISESRGLLKGLQSDFKLARNRHAVLITQLAQTF